MLEEAGVAGTRTSPWFIGEGVLGTAKNPINDIWLILCFFGIEIRELLKKSTCGSEKGNSSEK